MFFIFPNSNFHSHKFGYTREEEKAVVDSRKTKKGSDYRLLVPINSYLSTTVSVSIHVPGQKLLFGISSMNLPLNASFLLHHTHVEI